MFKRLLCIVILVYVLFTSFFAGDDPVQIIKSKSEKFRKSYPQEKIHLHLDKPFYSIGDTIYFKAYVVNAEKNVPSVLSNVIYVDFIDENNVIKYTLRRPVTDGTGWGSIDINDSLTEGNYRLRAYTNWMRNFNDDYFYYQDIPVRNGFDNDILADASFEQETSGNQSYYVTNIAYKSLHGYDLSGKEVNYSLLINNKELKKGKSSLDEQDILRISQADIHLQNQEAELITKIKITNKTTFTKRIKFKAPAFQHRIQFFPEGGQMINELESCVGFKAVGSNGLGTDVSGIVKDETSPDSVSFKSGFAGIGSFKFTPQADHAYYALVRYENGTEERTPLPKAEAVGYILSTENTDQEKVSINIASSNKLTASENVIVVAQCNNRIYYATTLTLTNSSVSTSISKKKLPTGILQITLFTGNMQPVAERLIFINHYDQLHINISLNH